MGISYLWDLLLACGKRVPIEFLSGKILAIDASIWIVKADSVFGDLTLTIRSILFKIILLMKAGVRPVFVFDGKPPNIKRNCLDLRRRRQLQMGQKQIKKLAQIQILRAIKGQKPKPKPIKLQKINDSQHSYSQQQQQQDSKIEIDLNSVPNSNDLILQQMLSQMLYQKYLFLKQTHPHLFFQYTSQQFINLSIEQKTHCIDQLQLTCYSQQKQRKPRNQPYQKALQRQLKMIQKRSKLNDLKDRMYRKAMQKIQTKKEQELEIVTGNYKGNSFQMTRRFEKKPMKNNMSKILETKYRNKIEEEEQQQVVVEQKIIELPKLEEGQSFTDMLRAGFIDEGDSDSQDDFAVFEKQTDKNAGQISIPFCQPISKVQIQYKTQTQKQEKEQKQEDKLQQQENKKKEQQEYPPCLEIFSSKVGGDTQKANIELRQLLELLGLPYVMAPSQAEAQCAQLEKCGLVDGIITQDSDAFAFGAQNVYRGVFQNDIKYYGQKQISQKIGFTQQQFIIFALFTGSDYTDGIKGVGLVNAMQIMKPFRSIDRLVYFREWAKIPDQLNPQNAEFYKTTNQQQKKFFQFHKNFKKYWYIDQTFPDKNVIQAYVSPTVQTIKQKFVFKQAKIQKLGLPAESIEARINDLKRGIQNMKISQTKITDYLSLRSQPIGKINSKRLQQALQK